MQGIKSKVSTISLWGKKGGGWLLAAKLWITNHTKTHRLRGREEAFRTADGIEGAYLQDVSVSMLQMCLGLLER